MKLFTLLSDKKYIEVDGVALSNGGFDTYFHDKDIVKKEYSDKQIQSFIEQAKEYVLLVVTTVTYYSSRSRYDGDNDWAYEDDDDDYDDTPTTYTSSKYIEIPVNNFLIKDNKVVGVIFRSLFSSSRGSHSDNCKIIGFTFDSNLSANISGLCISSRSESGKVSVVRKDSLKEGTLISNKSDIVGN